MMGKILGIDLGTTNSVAAIADGPTARVLDNKDNKSQTRSIVSLRRRPGKEDEILKGDVAFNNAPLAPRDTITSIKRLMGRGINDEEVQKVREHYLYQVVEPPDGTIDSVRVVMGGKHYSPVDISAMLLEKIIEDAEFKLGEKVTDAVITVPAYFSQVQKAATRLAGQKAGLRVIKILDEPTAAAIAFGMDSATSDDPKYICVYDLGGGTFDISILLWAGNVFSALNLEGDMWLGGDNFDQVLVGHALKYIEKEYSIDPRSDLRFMAELGKAAKEAKERLTTAKSTDIIVAGILRSDSGDLIDVEMEVTKSQFEDLVRPLVEKSIALVRTALKGKGADLTPEQIDYVIMAGNASCMPIVQEAVEKLFGAKKLKRDIHPKNCVAIGAAKVAAMLRDRIVCQAPDPKDPKRECGFINEYKKERCERPGCGAPLVFASKPLEVWEPDDVNGIAPFSYGVQIAGDDYRVFVNKGDSYPTQNPQPQTFFTLVPNQRIVAIPVYGGDHKEHASANEKQGDVFAVLPPGLNKGTPILVKVWLNSNGIFDLSAHLENGSDLHPIIDKGGSNAKAMGALQKVEAELDAKVKQLSPQQAAEAERIRDKALDAIKKGKIDEAVAEAGKVEAIIRDTKKPGADDLREKAENLIGFSQFLLSQYDWALDASKTYKLNQLVEETRAALDSDDRKLLEQKVDALDRETESLPQMLMVLLNMRGAINQVVGSRDPARAAKMMQKLDAVEEAFKNHDRNANQLLNALAVELGEEMNTKAEVVKCKGRNKQSGRACDHVFAPGEFQCPKCGSPNPKYQVAGHGHGGSTKKTGSGIISA